MKRRRKSILFLTQRFPYPPNKGDRIRTFHQIRHLAKSHDVYCACFSDDPSDAVHVPALKEYCRELLVVPWRRSRALLRAAGGLIRGEALSCSAYADSTMRRGVGEWCKSVRFDVATAFSSSMAPYALMARAKRRVLDLCDADSEKWIEYSKTSRWPGRMIYELEGRRLRQFERECVERFDAVMVITKRERETLGGQPCEEKIRIISNGVEIAPQCSDAWSCGPIIGFVGAMDYRPNVDAVKWFVEDIWPRIRYMTGSAEFRIIGRNPTASVRHLAQSPCVRVSGEVENVREAIDQCHVMVAPLRIARGLQNKVLEALSMARPLVITSAVAATMNDDSGDAFLAADSPSEFARSVVTLLRDDELCGRLAESGRRYVLENHCWNRVLDEYEAVLLGDSPAITHSEFDAFRIENAPRPSVLAGVSG